ncbi:hypothetical protein ACE193_00370 [Bernardetia sp. OM2101]|uniref:hypothetical protein n=1 Tax=Bernardetia sp. OM2101 TaxID=3344876 RepID=UPI0035D12C3A
MKYFIYILVLPLLLACKQTTNEEEKKPEEFFFYSVDRENYKDSKKTVTIYHFKTRNNGGTYSYSFIENDYNKINYDLAILAEGEYYPNTKLVAKRFKIKYHDEYTGLNGRIYIIDNIELLDSVPNYNKYNINDYIFLPRCSSDDILNLIEIEFYKTRKNEEEQWETFFDVKTLEQNKDSLTCDCEVNMKTSKRSYHVEFSFKKEPNGHLEIYGFKYE